MNSVYAVQSYNASWPVDQAILPPSRAPAAASVEQTGPPVPWAGDSAVLRGRSPGAAWRFEFAGEPAVNGDPFEVSRRMSMLNLAG